MAQITTPANVHDSIPAMPLADRVPVVFQKNRKRPLRLAVLMGDKAYGTARNVSGCEDRGIVSLLRRPRDRLPAGLGTIRYVVERTLACFGHFRRIRLCYERKGEHLQAFHDLAAAILCAKRLAEPT